MAVKKNNTIASETVTEEKKVNVENEQHDKEKDELLSIINSLKEEVSLMKEKLEAESKEKEASPDNSMVVDAKEIIETLAPKPEKRYTIINTSNGIVGILYREGGSPQILSSMGNTVSIKESMIDDIWRLNHRTFEDGYCAFVEQEAYDYLGISYLQKETLNLNTIKNLYSFDLKSLETMFNRCNEHFKEMINKIVPSYGDI